MHKLDQRRISQIFGRFSESTGTWVAHANNSSGMDESSVAYGEGQGRGLVEEIPLRVEEIMPGLDAYLQCLMHAQKPWSREHRFRQQRRP